MVRNPYIGHQGGERRDVSCCEEERGSTSSEPRKFQRVRLLMPAVLFTLSFYLHASTLNGGFVWDDRPAVLDNRDIWTDSSWGCIWRHDFWGQEMADADSHKSFRPLTTLTYRLNNMFARVASAASDSAKRVPLMDRVGPTDADAPGFHLVNIFVHAFTCAWSLILFRGIFSGEELPAFMSSLLFTIHPVHVEAVAPIVGRADLLCGLFAVIALSLTVRGRNTCPGRGNGQPCSRSTITTGIRAGSHRRGEEQHRNTSATIRLKETTKQKMGFVASAGFATKFTEPRLRAVDGNISKLFAVSDTLTGLLVHRTLVSRMLPEPETEPLKVESIAATESLKDLLHPPVLTVAQDTKQFHFGSECMYLHQNIKRTVDHDRSCRWSLVFTDSGTAPARFFAALVFTVAATLCKEVGVTVFGLLVWTEVVGFLEQSGWDLFNGRPPMAGAWGDVLASVTVLGMLLPTYRSRLTLLPYEGRISSALICAGALVAFHIGLHKGAAVREWGVLENDIAILPSLKERTLSYAYTHAVYASKLLWPGHLCYDWGFRCIPHVTAPTDPAVLAPLGVYAAIIVAAANAVSRWDTIVIWGLALIVVPFVPASNVLLPVGAVVAERLLYLPSLGACVLAGRTLLRGSTRGSSGCDGPWGNIADGARSTGDGVMRRSRWGFRAGISCGSLKVPIILFALLSWAAVFGARTVRRCEDWKSERRLFESALQVCPDGIKTLNNLAVGMLNVDEAARAEELLTRAVELHSNFSSALFNLGVARMLRGNHGGAIVAMERSLALEPQNAKTMVYLGLEYLTLTKRALGNTVKDAVLQPKDQNVELLDPDLLDVSPESLLSRSETIIDRVFASGSGLPLARLVKGDALVLRGNYRLAAGYFQNGIDLSRNLLNGIRTSGRGGTSGVERGVSSSDALDIPAVYNRLGLALREAGSSPIVVKEAFLAGLLTTPEDFALLVNGGAAHHAAGDIAGARALYHRALLVNHTSPEVLSNLGWLEEESGGGSRESLEKAAELYGRALEVFGMDSPSATRGQVEVNLANVRRRLGEIDEGGAVFYS